MAFIIKVIILLITYHLLGLVGAVIGVMALFL